MRNFLEKGGWTIAPNNPGNCRIETLAYDRNLNFVGYLLSLLLPTMCLKQSCWDRQSGPQSFGHRIDLPPRAPVPVAFPFCRVIQSVFQGHSHLSWGASHSPPLLVLTKKSLSFRWQTLAFRGSLHSVDSPRCQVSALGILPLLGPLF